MNGVPQDALPPEAGSPPRRQSLVRRLAWTLAALLLPIAVALLALGWALRASGGTAWLLERLPGVTVMAPQGTLIGDFSAERVEIALPGSSDRIVIGGLRWRGLSFARATSQANWLRLEIDSLQADRVDVLITPDPGAQPLAPPQSLRFPLEVEFRAIDIAELHAPLLGDLPLRGLHAQLHLSADAGRTHRIDALSLAWDRLAASGAATISSAAPFDIEALLAIAPRQTDPLPGLAALPPFDATLTARGPLAELALQATLRGICPAARPGTPAPSLDLRASVLPFAAWPLGALQAQTRELDLAALYSNAPGTSLTGTAQIESAGPDRPATVAIGLTNARAGRIDEGLLPLRSLQADVRARPDDPTKVDIHALDIALGTAREAGGRVQGRGSWTPQSTSLDATLTDIAPRVLDARAPAMRFSGRADLRADDWLVSTGRSGAGTTPSLALRGHFSGSLPQQGRQQGVRLDLDATATSSRIELKGASLQAGDSSATFTGQALRQGSGGWQLKGQGTLAGFDPAQWWPGADGSAWRKGPHRFDGTLAMDALLPANVGKATLSLQQLATAQGQATLHVTDSLLAGAPLAGELTLRGEGESGLDVSGSLALAGAKLALRGRLAPDARDHWEIEASAADLAPWAVLLQLLRPVGVPALALAGGLAGEARFDGRWPQMSSSGRLALTDLRASKLRLARAALRWTASTAPKAPLDVQAEIEQLGVDPQKLDHLRLSVQGTAAEHRITISAESPVRPPSWIDVLHGADKAPAGGNGEPATGTLAELSAQGELQFDAAWQQPLRWHGRVLQLDARRRGGNLPAPWFHSAESELDAQYDPVSGSPRFALGPGRAELPNLALRWDQFRWQGGAAPLLDVQAEIEPFGVAPLLARLQPDFGWGGDLVLAGHLRLRSAPSFVAEVEFGRQRGDLNLTDEAGTQALELTDLRLGLDARDGVWNFTTALAGKSLGAMASEATVRTDAKAFWPPASAPLQGVLEVQVANLAAWGAWAPTGWRMKGTLRASASLGGTFGAPEYTGQIDGSGLGVRNLAEGVDLHDGEVRITLQGETARIERLEARAGDGSLRVSGNAVFGASPQAELRVVAERLLLLGRVDRRIVVSGDTTLQLDPHSLALDGQLIIDQGLIDFSRGNAPSLGDDVHVLREAKTANPDAAASRAGPARDVKMKLAVDLGPALRLRGRGLDTRLQGDLRLTAPNGRLAVNGTVNAAPGTFAAYGQKLTIERGTVSFSGAVENPRLDILALRPNLDIRVGVAVTGSAINPRVSLFSDPDLPDNDKLSWLVLGRAPEGVGGSDTALIQAAAMALLAGQGDGQLAELTRLNPLDTLSVRRNDGVVHDTVVNVGKQLSQRWYIGYERSLTATSGNWQLIYRIAQRFTVRLQTGIDNSIDLIWSWRWQ